MHVFTCQSMQFYVAIKDGKFYLMCRVLCAFNYVLIAMYVLHIYACGSVSVINHMHRMETFAVSLQPTKQ